jgi:hypothetical protein
MTKQANLLRNSLDGSVLGYASEDRIIIASLNLEGGRIKNVEFLKFFSSHEVIAHFVERPSPLGIGLRGPLALSTGRQGWRPCDYWIDEAPFHLKSDYDEFPFYWGPYQSSGHPALEAIGLLLAMRRIWASLPATECDAVEYHCQLNRSDKFPSLPERTAKLANWLEVELPPDMTEAGWQAVMNAFAMWMGLRGDWAIDLHKLTRPAGEGWQCSFLNGQSIQETWVVPAMSYDSLLFPAGPISFFWPPDERLV